MTKESLVLRNAFVVGEKKTSKADIFIKNGLISAVTRPFLIKRGETREINLTGLTVFPGLIDAHTHFHLKLGGNKYNSDTFLSGTAAAACGGITCVIDFTHQKPGESLISGIKERLKDAKGAAYCDYSFHCVIPSFRKLKSPAKQLSEAMGAGITSFKIFTAYKARQLMLEDCEIRALLKLTGKAGALICVHAEDEKTIAANTLKIKRANSRLGMDAHLLVRNEKSETEAVKKMINLSSLTKAPVYIVHLSSAAGAFLIKKARKKGIRIMAETCPQYLLLDSSVYLGPNGHLYGFCPPARTKKDNEGLWEAIREGTILNATTDSCAFTKKQKNLWNGDLEKLLMGIPSSQLLFPLLYTFGVKKKKLSLTGLKNIISSNPARIMGLERRGEIKPGNRADLAVFDLSKKFRVSWKNLRHKSDYSPYEGLELTGTGEYTLLAGEIIAKKGKLTSKPRGIFAVRKKPEII